MLICGVLRPHVVAFGVWFAQLSRGVEVLVLPRLHNVNSTNTLDFQGSNGRTSSAINLREDLVLEVQRVHIGIITGIASLSANAYQDDSSEITIPIGFFIIRKRNTSCSFLQQSYLAVRIETYIKDVDRTIPLRKLLSSLTLCRFLRP